MPGPSSFKDTVKRWTAAGSLSLLIHSLFLLGLFAELTGRPAPPKKIVTVEPITLATVTPKPAGGGGGQPAAPPQTPSPPPKKAAPKPVAAKPKPQPKPLVKPPEPTPVPPALALPRPAPPASSRTTPGPVAAAGGSSQGSGAGTGQGVGSGSGSGSGRGSGSGSGSGHGSGSVLQGYLHQVRQLLEKNKHYPMLARRRHEEGTVILRFVIQADGGFTALQVTRSSGHASLDEAAQETVQRVRRFPPLPQELQRSQLPVEVPLAFRLHSS